MTQKIVSFCFDDGFLQSAISLRQLFEARGLRATFCVLAAPERSTDRFISVTPIADWAFWKEALAAGHDVEPHGYTHEHLGQIPLDEATASIEKTWDAFAHEFPGFEPRQALYHVSYLVASEPVVDFLKPRALGVRRAIGNRGVNRLEGWSLGDDVDCISFGDPASEKLSERLEAFVANEEGWLVIVLHGVDGEGYGPLPAQDLGVYLDRLIAQGVQILPASTVLKQALKAQGEASA